MLRSSFLPLILSLVLMLGVMACSDDSSEVDDPDGDNASDGDTPTDGDDGDVPDGDDPTDGDTDGDADEGGGGNCEFPRDCTEKEDCIDGECVPASKCSDYSECESNQICWYASREAAVGYCRVYCTTDMGCAENAHCINGLCEPYTPIEEGTPPEKHPEWEGKLHVAYAEGALEYPFTVTMQGYGLRKGPSSPYSEAMGGSKGVYDRLMVRAMTMDDGINRVVFVTIPTCLLPDFMVTGIIKEVIALGGPDLRNNLVASVSHTHSGPGRLWNLLPNLGFGSLGFGTFSYEVYSRLTKSIAKVVNEAQQNFRPASFGYAINPEFDPEDKINRDRRSQNDHFKDPRLIVWRIDDLSGEEPKPWIVTINYATHGTVEDQVDSFLTDDSAGGAANMTQLLYERDHPGEKIHTMFFNGMAGDVSPSGGLSTDHTQQDMLIGVRVYAKVMELFDSIELSDEVNIKVVSKRVPIDRNYIGYSDDEFWSDGTSFGEYPPGGPIRFGAFQCGLLNGPVEENLDLFLYDADGNELKSSTDLNSKSEGEEIGFTPDADGTFYIKVEGIGGAMDTYDLMVVEDSRGARVSDPCIDATCGKACGTCISPKSLPPVECVEDAFEENDDMSQATPIEVSSEYTNLNACPHDADWFAIDLTAGVRVSVRLMFDQNDNAYNPESTLQDGNLGCVLVVEKMNHGPIPQFSKTRFTSILFDIKNPSTGLSNTLYLAGLPGEPTSRIGVDALTSLENATTFDDIVVFGYTNDHHFYITGEDDWMQAGYNTEMSIWGMRFGEFLIKHLTELAVALSEGREAEVANEFPNIKPANFTNLEDDTRVPDITAMPTDASFVIQPTDTVRFEQQMVVKWIGGDPGADLPKSYLERKNEGGEFEQVTRVSGRPYDDRYYETKMEFDNEHFRLPNKPDADPNNYWTLTWEERKNFQVGTYRWRIEGTYYDGPTDHYDWDNGRKSYTIYSAEFDLLPASIQAQDVKVIDGDLSASIRYRGPITNNNGENEFESIKCTGLLLGSVESQCFLPARVMIDDIIEGTVVLLDSAGDPIEDSVTDISFSESTGEVFYVSSRDAEGVETVGAQGGLPVTLLSGKMPLLDPGEYTARVTITDTYGNTGWTDAPLVIAR